MTIDIQYQPKEYQMDKLSQDLYNPESADKIRKDIKAAGDTILSKITKLENSIPDRLKRNIKFLVVIEGQSSKVAFNESVWKNNYTLSYLRAQYLNEFWKSNGIDLGSLPRCELIISGSGEGGKPRIEVDTEKLHRLYPDPDEFQKHWIEEEVKNQRFLVHIVPVIGNIDVTKERMDNLKSPKK
jgi:hypothetical protein